jgi:diguanylate cyclase (GGDEF)-like protein
MDRFQVVNDLCGFEGGDKLLQTVTDILLSYLPEGGVLGRIGDDEFSMLLKEENLEAGYQAAEMLRQTIDETVFDWQGRMIPTTASIGVVEIDSGDQRADKLMQTGLAACNMAKQSGGNCTRIYLKSDSIYQQRQQLVESLPGIKEALAKGRMELFVQPIVPLQSNQMTSYHHEILHRVRNEKGDHESPQAFIEAAETYDLMRDVDRWVVEAFFKQLEPYAQHLPAGQSFSINLSGKSLSDMDFKQRLIKRIKETTLDSKHFGFEITETALVGDISDTAATINEIRELGCAFSLDDFGSGYASFSYLKDFPVDFVKIDGIFVREILNKPADYAMISSITEIAHFMEKKVIAEFVSDETTAMALKHMGVDFGQGYHFGKPVPLDEVLKEIIATDKKVLH